MEKFGMLRAGMKLMSNQNPFAGAKSLRPSVSPGFIFIYYVSLHLAFNTSDTAPIKEHDMFTAVLSKATMLLL